MSAVTPAARAIKQADSGIGNWLMDLVTGAGSSPGHIIVTGILGVVPGVGQAMDARDVIISIIVIAKSPMSVSAWVNLVINLIGCVPAVGDALKVGFKLMKQGRSFGRVLEAVSPKLRGNVQKYMQNVNWGALIAQTKSLFFKCIDAFIDGLDSWAVKMFAGRKEVAAIIAELQGLRRRAPKMIDEAFAELKIMHTRMLGHEVPRNTAAVRPPAPRPQAPSRAALAEQQRVAAARVQRRLAAKRAAKEKAPTAQPNATNTATKKKAEPKKQSWSSGIPAEHITDYYVKRKHIHFRKAKNGGQLIEEHSVGHNGLDHLWANYSAGREFVVGETKSSIFDSFKLMAALPADLQEAFNALRADEAANPTRNDRPNIFASEDRDRLANRRVGVGGSDTQDTELRKGLAAPNAETGLHTQMSHKWIEERLPHPRERLTAKGSRLPNLIRDWLDGDIDECPYNRWISLVTGRQLHKHRQSGGSTHEVQVILNLPDNILER
ncbi:hypothetical protein [Massilia agri]|uniref:Uncharacterized protein n=1 Tax=Massilia agri TaxID=1886785 RepID=A0ABT2APF3_9BURK|nr:hypothetical protein [Massilia agri]MCS0598112.1 hypothetical protein [Massilia agri]